MDKYLICIDLDSTFLKDDKTISDHAKEYVRRLTEAGHLFVINTGRPHQGAIEFLKELNIHTPIIANNGSIITYYNKDYTKVESYHSFDLDINIVKEFYSEVKEFINTCAITSPFDFYSSNMEKCPFFIIHKDEQITFHEGDISVLLNTNPIHAEFFIKHENLEEFIKVLNKEKYQNHFDYIHWGEWDDINSFEMYSKTSSKGKAMEFLAKKYGINPKNTISFGDQLNDISMIEYSYDGVAMDNARHEVKLIANHITKKDNNDDGVVSYLENLNLI